MVSVVPCPTNCTESSAIYKLTSGLAGWLAQHCTSIVSCPPNSTRSSAIYNLTDELQGWRAQDCDCLRMVIPINYLTLSKNITFNTKLLILNIDIVQFNCIKLLKDVKSLILKKMKETKQSITTTNLNFKGLLLI